MEYPLYLVICRDDDTPDGYPGEYRPATHLLFKDKTEAQRYADTVFQSREPIVVTLHKELR